MRCYTEIHVRVHIYNRNQHCQSNEPNGQNKSIKRHLLRMNTLGFIQTKSVFVGCKTDRLHIFGSNKYNKHAKVHMHSNRTNVRPKE